MNKYFVWDGSPELATIPEIQLPFSFSLAGLIIAYLAWAWFNRQQQEKKASPKRKQVKAESESISQKWMYAIGFLVIGQIIGFVFNLLIWDSIGPISLRWYGLLFATSFVIGYLWGGKLFNDIGFSQAQIDSLLTYMIVAVVAGARLGHCLFYDPVYYLNNPLKILAVWEGGLASHGAAIGIVLSVYLFTQKNKPFTFWMIMDRLSIVIAVGTALIRLGNFFNSEIIGVPTHVPWAIIFEREDQLPRHPTMLYESFSYMLGIALFSYIYYAFKRNPPEGLLFGIFLMYMFTARFIIEISKTSQAAFEEVFMSMGQWLSVPFILFGLYVIIQIGMKNYRLIKQSS